MTWHLRLLGVMILVALLTACEAVPPTATMRAPTVSATATASPTATLTPTPSPSATPTASSTPTPSPTPSPTSTPQASALATRAARALRNGDYATAISLYDQVLARATTEALRRQAQWERAQALWYDGQAEAARQAFAALAGDVEFRQDRPEVYYWLARASAAVGQPDAAADAWRIAAERLPSVGALAYEQAGDAYVAAQVPQQALPLYEQALAGNPGLIPELRIREKMAEANLAENDAEAAIAQYRIILKKARNAAYRTEIWYRLGQAQMAAGDQRGAFLSWHQATITAPDNSFAYLALAELVDAGEPVDALLRARIDVAAGAITPALAVLNDYLAANPQHSGEPHALMARAYEQMGDYSSAARQWRELIDTHPGDKRVSKAWLGQARSLWRMDDVDAARQIYLAAADAVPDAATAASALWWAGVLAEREEEQLSQAAQIFGRLWRTYPGHANADRAGFRAGLALYRLQRWSEAQALWQEVAAADAGMWSAAADFWLGRLAFEQDDLAAAERIWQDTVTRWGSGNYYGIRAAQWLQEVGATPPSAQATVPDDVVGWIRSWLPAGEDVEPVSLEQEMDRVRILHRVGDHKLAYDVLNAYAAAWARDPLRSLALAQQARIMGDYAVSIRAARAVGRASTQALESWPPTLQQLVYPRYYDDLIGQAARRYDVDRALLLALVRQESHFGSAATSTAAARGLTQVIPATGKTIAAQLGWTDYDDALLYLPYVSVEFGAYYLAQGLQQAEGSVVQALAGYNGGPGNAAFWRQLAGADDDLYVEVISFDETQAYVRQVLWQAELYRRIYPDLR